MDLRQLKKKYKGFGGDGVKRDDLSKNLGKHLETEINAFAEETELSFSQSLNLFSPEPEDGKGYTDATLDCISRRGLRTNESKDGIPASPCKAFFDEDDVNFALGIAYQQNIFSRCLGKDIDGDRRRASEYLSNNQVVNSNANYRSTLPHPFNPETIGDLEMRRNYMPRVRIADIIAMRRTVIGDEYEAPIVESPTDTKLRPIGETESLPRYTVTTAAEKTKTSEIGYELALSDKVRRSTSVTMDAITEIQVQKARQVENAIVNLFISDIISGISSEFNLAISSPMDSADIIKMHLMADDDYMITTIIGTIDALVEYADADIFYKSDNMKPVTPRSRNFIDEMLGNELIAKKTSAEVSALTDKKFVAFDRRRTYDYITEQRGTVQETYRENRERMTVIQNSHMFAGRKRAEADRCRWFGTIS